MYVEEAAVERGSMVKSPSRKERGTDWGEMMVGPLWQRLQTDWMEVSQRKQDLSEEDAVLQTKHIEIFYIGRDTISQTTIRNTHSPNFNFNQEK